MSYKRLYLGACILLIGATTAAQSLGQEFDYPKTKTVDQVDEYHGIKVPDPYRWLEDDVRVSDEVRNWVTAQNELTFGYLKKLPYREQIEKRLTELWDYEKYSAPQKVGDKYYFSKNDGLQNQSVIYEQPSLDAEPKVFIDPNKWSKDGTVALGGLSFSENGKFAAYGIAKGGSDWRTWKVMEADSQKILDEELKWIKFGDVAWTIDEKGFYYGRYDEPKEGEEFQSLNLGMKVFYHTVGTPQSDDKLVYEDPENPKWGYGLSVTEDGRYLVVTVWKGTANKYRIKYKDLTQADSGFVDLIDSFDYEFSFVGGIGPELYFICDKDAPRKKVVAINVNHPEEEHWKTVLPESENTLNSVSLTGGKMVADYLEHAKSVIKIFNPDGTFVRDVELPGIGTAGGFGGKFDQTETFYSFSSFATPPSIYRYDMASGKSELFRQAEVGIDPENYVVKQVFYQSKDGTKIPMFIAHKKGIELDGSNPTLLYGYGGFSISLTPGFSISRVQWMEMGGVLAVANLRGGGEYGEDWHIAGTKTQKQNVFDDFIAAAEWLCESKYTKPAKLAIQGGSNGGLLVGACMTQRPDLFGACLPAVGVMDMLRFDNFTAGRFWVDDYGSAQNSIEEFKALSAYSPYHNIEAGTEYPPTLITTADTDDRVVPGHSFKFAARIQAAQAGSAPTLIRIETDAGHGAGKPTSKLIEEVADQWAFLVKHLEMKPDLEN
jgi:prolyl oligopeptidase